MADFMFGKISSSGASQNYGDVFNFSISPPHHNITESTTVGPTYVTTLLALLAIVFNVITVAAVCKIKGKLASNIRLVCSLVGADITASVAYLFESSHEIHFVSSFYMEKINPGLQSKTNCFRLAIEALLNISHNASLLSITCLGIDIFIAIIYPLNYLIVMNKSRVNILLVAVWGISVIFGLFPVIYPVYSFQITVDSMQCNNHSLITAEHVTLVILVLSVLVLTFVYSSIFWQIHQMQHDPTRSSRSQQNNVRGMVTTLAILFIFLVCFLPRYISQYINMETRNLKIDEYESVVWGVHLRNLSLMHGVLDPLIYAYRLRDVKQGYRNLFGINRKRRNFSTINDKRGVSSICDQSKKRSYEMSRFSDKSFKTRNDHSSIRIPNFEEENSVQFSQACVHIVVPDNQVDNSLLEESLTSSNATDRDNTATTSLFRTLSMKISTSLQFPSSNCKTLSHKRYSQTDIDLPNSRRFSFDIEESTNMM